MNQTELDVNRISSIKSNDSMNLFSKLSLQDNDIINPYEDINMTCDYMSIKDSFCHMKGNSGLKVLSWNIQSLNSKFNEFLDFIKGYEYKKCYFDIIVI